MKQNEANMWDKQMSMAQVFDRWLRDLLSQLLSLEFQLCTSCSFTLSGHFYQLSYSSKQMIQLQIHLSI